MTNHCPVCHKPLTQLKTTSGREYFLCFDCGGRALPLELVESAVTPLTYRRLLNHFRATKTRSDRKCPACTAYMRPVDLEILGRSNIVDMCPKCGTVWFDHVEFGNLPFAAGAEAEFALPPEARHALGELEVLGGRVVANRKSFKLDARDFGLGWDTVREGTPGGWRLILGILGIPVERDLEVVHKPWATWSILAITALVSYLGFASPELIEALGVNGNNGAKWGGLTYVTYFLVHGGWFHLLGNMYYLWLFGDNVEDELGPLTLVAVLAAGTAGGALLHTWLDPNGEALLVGASGGISTLGMMYMLRFPRAKLAFFALIRWVRLPAYTLLIVWVALQLQGAYEQIGGFTQVSALCHLGGALVGLGAHFILKERPAHWRI